MGARRDVCLLRVKGYIDTQTCSKMLAEINDVLREDIYHIIVDMSQVNYVSSAGWGVFVGEIKGIRENGGDLKIAQMSPEVNDIFEMLEFNRILDTYDNVEEAIDDFDLSVGLDLTKSISRSFKDGGTGEITETIMVPKPQPAKSDQKAQRGRRRASFNKPREDEKMLPLSEQVKRIVIQDPRLGVWQIKRALFSERFGYRKPSLFQIYKVLRRLNLNSKEKRFRYYRSR